MADKGLTEKGSTDAAKAAVPSRREPERDSLPIELGRVSAPGAAGAEPPRVVVPPPPAPRSPLRRIAEDLTYSVRSWAASTFTREQLVAGLKSLAWVAPLTVLIWIYAEREQLYTVPSVTIPIEVIHSDPTRVVTVVDPSDGHLLVTLKGPRGEVEAVQEQFRDSASPVPIELERDVDTGELTIRAERVGMDRRFTSRGVTVSNSQPGTLRVKVDTLDEMEVEVKPKFPLPTGYQVKFVPATVKIKIPSSVVSQTIVERNLNATVDLVANDELKNARDSGKASVTMKDLPLTLAATNKHARLVDVKTVTAEVTFKAQAERVLPFVGVWPSGPPEVLNGYVIDYQLKTVPNVTVIGPEDQLEKLLDPAKPPVAVFFVSADDAKDAANRGDTGKSAPLVFQFPEGVKLKPRGPNESAPTVTYKVKLK